MWAAKIIIPSDEGMLLASRAKKYNITIQGYPINNFEKNKRFYLLASTHIIGDKENKEKFLKDLKKDKRSIKIDMMNSSFGFWLMEQPKSIKPLYDPLIIHTKPAIISKEGENIFEIASWDKEKLAKISKTTRSKEYGGKLIYIKQKKITNIAIKTAFPELTQKQKQSIELAIQNGYYGYPRKTDIKKLAKLMKISHSTFQFHLRNAEKKLMPFIFSDLSLYNDKN
jgi:predicted DNA binding protein